MRKPRGRVSLAVHLDIRVLSMKVLWPFFHPDADTKGNLRGATLRITGLPIVIFGDTAYP